MLGTATPVGLHDFFLNEVVRSYQKGPRMAVDLGAGSGILAVRLRALGWDVRAADRNAEAFEADVPFTQADFNTPDFAAKLGDSSYDLVTSVEVIEHIESPINFLRNVGRLLKPEGVAILTTPNVDSFPARIKFLIRGRIRMMDEASDPTHISPIFWDLLLRQYLPAAGLELVEHRVFPPRGFQLMRPGNARLFKTVAKILPGESLAGDHHVLVLRRRKIACA